MVTLNGLLVVSTCVSITDCSWKLYSDDIIFVIICRKTQQSWPYKRTCLCQDDKKKPLQKIISFKNQDMKLKGILLSNSKTFEGAFRHEKKERNVSILLWTSRGKEWQLCLSRLRKQKAGEIHRRQIRKSLPLMK